MKPTAYSFSEKEIKVLQKKFNSLKEVTSFSLDIQFSSKIASYGMLREIGTVNDELARFIFDAGSGNAVRLTSLKAEMIKWKHLYGLRIWSTDTQNLELRTAGFYEIVHPGFSKNEIPANLATVLTQFPQDFQKIIDLSRTVGIEKNLKEINATIDAMTSEIRRASVIVN